MTRDEILAQLNEVLQEEPNYRERVEKLVDSLGESPTDYYSKPLIKNVEKVLRSDNPEKGLRSLEALLLQKSGQFVFKNSGWIVIFVIVILDVIFLFKNGFTTQNLVEHAIGWAVIIFILMKRMSHRQDGN